MPRPKQACMGLPYAFLYSRMPYGVVFFSHKFSILISGVLNLFHFTRVSLQALCYSSLFARMNVIISKACKYMFILTFTSACS